MQYLNRFMLLLVNDKILLNPCTENDIKSLERITKNKTLPEAYLEFMRKMGRGASFLRGYSCFMNEIFDLRQGSEELLIENNFGGYLTDNDFVFWMAQGYMFCFFKLDEGNDPPVYFYTETSDQDEFYKIADSFSEFLLRFYYKDKTLFLSN